MRRCYWSGAFFWKLRAIFMAPIDLNSSSPTRDFVISSQGFPPKAQVRAGDVSDEHGFELPMLDCLSAKPIGLSDACREAEFPAAYGKQMAESGLLRPTEVSTRLPAGGRPGRDEIEDDTQDQSRGCTQPAAHPAATSQNGRRLPALRSGRECNGRSPPTPSRAWRAIARPTKGGAVRIRIALGTAVAVIVIPAFLFAFFSSTSAASARVTRHEASSRHRAVKIDDN